MEEIFKKLEIWYLSAGVYILHKSSLKAGGTIRQWGSNWNSGTYGKNEGFARGIINLCKFIILPDKEVFFLRKRHTSSGGNLLPQEETYFLRRKPTTSGENLLPQEETCFLMRKRTSLWRNVYFLVKKRTSSWGSVLPEEEIYFLRRKRTSTGWNIGGVPRVLVAGVYTHWNAVKSINIQAKKMFQGDLGYGEFPARRNKSTRLRVISSLFLMD